MSTKNINTSENRDRELEEKIIHYTQKTTITVNTSFRKKSKPKIGIYIGGLLIGTQFLALCFFCLMFLFSYIPQTKNIVSAVLP